MADQLLVPDYMNIDFATMKSALQDQLSQSTVFNDYDVEGSNITILLEMLCYLGSLTTFYLNKIAKNQYIETSDVYETTHMLAKLRGYDPKGYISSSGELTLSIDASAGVSPGDIINIEKWSEFECSAEVDDDGNTIKFALVEDYTETIPVSATFPYNITLHVKQGDVIKYVEETSSNFKGNNLIDNKLYVNDYNFDYDNDLDDEYTSIDVIVNGVEWTRLSDFYDTISRLEDINDAYLFKYNKYGEYYIEFSTLRNIPALTDVIEVILLKSLGANSNVGIGLIDTIITDNFLYNQTKAVYVDNTYLTVSNENTITGGADPETIDEIKQSSESTLHSQFRNITKSDYITYLEAFPTVDKAVVWGEQDIAPSGSVLEYNKIHISVIPTEWGDSTISTSAASGSVDNYENVVEAVEYSELWKADISRYLEPRKILCTYEEYELPELVYFSFDIGIKLKRTYTMSNVAKDVRDKLIYYFDVSNRDFNEVISFTNIIDYIMDSTITKSLTDTFSQVKGIQTLVIRDINIVNKDIAFKNSDGVYPQYTSYQSDFTGDNILRNIELGFNQFPVLATDLCTFIEEE